MNLGRTVFSQLLTHLPDREFRRCVERYRGDYPLRGFSCWDQFLCMAFAQSLIARACEISKHVCGLRLRSFTTWAFGVGFPAPLWPMPTKRTTGASSPISRSG